MRPGQVIVALWLGFAVSWLLAARWSAPAAKRIASNAEATYRVFLVLGGIVLFIPAHGYEGPLRLWHFGFLGVRVCIAMMVVGFAFTWWARIHLGRLWSGNITTKENHRVVDTGPYGLVRHPIYTGLLLATLATTAAKGTVLGLAGAALVIAGIWLKARLEERWLSAELGSDAYSAYRRRVPMLVPFGPKAV